MAKRVAKEIIEQIEDKNYTEVIGKSFMTYAMSIIIARALPDIRDGLKPVQRRILYGMNELKIYHNTSYKKSARVVGDVMGKYHPHGDSSIYEAMVNMAQTFKQNKTVVDGQGNYGSIEGDKEAAMRYTEARLTSFAQDVILDGNTPNVVPYIDNYDQSEKEPVYLPAKLPYAVLNGSEGIAVGMATKIPPHNISELIKALSYVLKTSNPEIDRLLELMPGPDFPTGGIISNKDDLKEIYETGKGSIRIRGEMHYEPAHKDKESGKKIPDALVITSIPYTMIGEELVRFMNKIKDLSLDGTLAEVVNIENHSSGDDVRIVLYLKKNSDIDYITNTIYKKTKLESTYASSFLFIDNQQPVRYPMIDLLKRFGEEQKTVYIKQLNEQLEKSLKKKEINEGLLRAIKVMDVIMEIAQGSKSAKAIKNCLMTGDIKEVAFKNNLSKMIASEFNFTEAQADAILKLTVSRMVGLEVTAIRTEYNELVLLIEKIQKILSDEGLLIKKIISDLSLIDKKYGNKRKTKLDNLSIENIEKEKEEVEQVVLVDNFGYVHTISKQIYDKNKETIYNDFRYVIETSNLKKLFIFTDLGNVHSVKVESIPYGSLRYKGEPLDNLTNYDSSKEVIINCFSICDKDDRDLFIATSDGFAKRMALKEVETSRKTTSYIKQEDNNHVVHVDVLKSEEDFVFADNMGKIVKLPLSKFSPKKRTAKGAVAIKLSQNATLKWVIQLEVDQNIVEINDKKIKISSIKGK